jgi:hypothetical protein
MLHICCVERATIFGVDSFKYEFADQAGSKLRQPPEPSKARLDSQRSGRGRRNDYRPAAIAATSSREAGSTSLRGARTGSIRERPEPPISGHWSTVASNTIHSPQYTIVRRSFFLKSAASPCLRAFTGRRVRHLLAPDAARGNSGRIEPRNRSAESRQLRTFAGVQSGVGGTAGATHYI